MVGFVYCIIKTYPIKAGEKVNPSREETMQKLAQNYYYFLKSLPFSNTLYMNGMKEARNKFLANLHIVIMKEYLPRGYKNWRYSTDFVSERALALLKKRKWGKGELVYEHIVPKTEFITRVCEQAAEDNEISTELIYNLLMKYFWTATIHKDENVLLPKDTMPTGWNKENVFARYNEVNIELIPHNKSYFLQQQDALV